jgi:heme exporter protein D
MAVNYMFGSFFKFVWWATIVTVIVLNMYIMEIVKRIDERVALVLSAPEASPVR